MAGEAKLEKTIQRLIVEKKGLTRKIKWISRHGAPDRLVWVPGWKFPEFWELKNAGKPLEDHQVREHRRLRRAGMVCRKVDTIEQAQRLLR